MTRVIRKQILYFRLTIHKLNGDYVETEIFNIKAQAWRAAVVHMRKVGSLSKSAVAHIPKNADEIDSGMFRYTVSDQWYG